MTHPLGSLGGEAELASSLAWGDCVPGAGVRLWPGLLALVGTSARGLCTLRCAGRTGSPLRK